MRTPIGRPRPADYATAPGTGRAGACHPRRWVPVRRRQAECLRAGWSIEGVLIPIGFCRAGTWDGDSISRFALMSYPRPTPVSGLGRIGQHYLYPTVLLRRPRPPQKTRQACAAFPTSAWLTLSGRRCAANSSSPVGAVDTGWLCRFLLTRDNLSTESQEFSARGATDEGQAWGQGRTPTTYRRSQSTTRIPVAWFEG